MSLRDEIAADIASIVADDPTEFIFNSASFRGRVSTSVPTVDNMLDAGYDPGKEIMLTVTTTELNGSLPDQRDEISIGDVTYTVTARRDCPRYYAYTLKLQE